jgi:starch-binding outer membrane protein, SusD/RagB family
MHQTPRTRRRLAAATLVLVAGAAGCTDFLTGGELSVDPNRPTAATNTQLFVGVQSNLWSVMTSDPARVTGLWARQFRGGLQQYVDIYNYGISEQTTNGFHSSLYIGGGLVDVRRLQEGATAANDRLLLGISQVQEALMIGTGADLFGDLVYSQALTGDANPVLDDQLAIYDALQALLTEAIANIATTGASNVGPADADLTYGGDAAKWTRLAHTVKARLFMHTAEMRGQAAYQSALAESRLGISSPADNFSAPFSGGANEQNFWYQFAVVQRPGYLEPDPYFVGLLQARNDPRLTEYFNADLTDLSDERLAPDFTQPLVTANENLLIRAEAAARTGGEIEARQQLDAARALAGLSPVSPTLTGQPLLNEILIEKYIANFQSIEAWNDYKRTCTPNLTPVDPSRKIPARLLYDSAERQTNQSIPLPSAQPTRNANDPPNTLSDGTGDVCLGQ